MRRIVILRAGAGGTIVANMLRQKLPESEWQIVIIDRDDRHHYQAGYLFIPFGIYGEADVLKPKKEFIPPGVDFVLDKVVRIDKGARSVETLTGKRFDYDWLVIATGCDIHPEEKKVYPSVPKGEPETFAIPELEPDPALTVYDRDR